MPKSTEHKWGYLMEESDVAKDGLIAAWGARAIVNWEAGGCYINRDTPFQLLGNRQSVTGDTKLCQAIMDIWNKKLSEAVGKFIVANKDVEYEVMEMYPSKHEDVSNPVDVKVRLAGGYAYIRVGLRKPVEIGKYKTHDAFVADDSPKGEQIWMSESRPEVGSEISVHGFEGVVLTYVKEGIWQYGMMYSEEWFDHKHSKSNFFDKADSFGHPWACFRSFIPHEIDNK